LISSSALSAVVPVEASLLETSNLLRALATNEDALYFLFLAALALTWRLGGKSVRDY
jgi:hypothetical protein